VSAGDLWLKETRLLPEEKVGLCVVGDGAECSRQEFLELEAIDFRHPRIKDETGWTYRSRTA